MDARALALALALPLTARAATWFPTTTTRYPTAPPHAQPATAARDVVSRACSLGVFSPARELLRDHLRVGAAAEARGRTLAARGLGFQADDLSLALSFGMTARALRSSTDGLTLVLDLPTAALPPATAAQDAGLQACRRRGLSVVCRASRLGTASPAPAPAPTLLQPASGRPRRPRLLLRFQAPRSGHLNRSTPSQTTGNVTDKKPEETNWNWNLHIFAGYLVVAAKSKFKFHVAVGSLVLAARVATYLAGVLQTSEFISNRVKLPEIVVTAAAMSFLLGKSLFALIKETKEFVELVLYFVTLYKESVDSATADSNKDAVVTSGIGAPSAAASDTGPASDTDAASYTCAASDTGLASDAASDTGLASDAASDTGVASDAASDTGVASDAASDTGLDTSDTCAADRKNG